MVFHLSEVIEVTRFRVMWHFCAKITLLRKLQSVQNAAARLLTRTGRREHITSVLKQLHWLHVAVISTLSWQC